MICIIISFRLHSYELPKSGVGGGPRVEGKERILRLEERRARSPEPGYKKRNRRHVLRVSKICTPLKTWRW